MENSQIITCKLSVEARDVRGAPILDKDGATVRLSIKDLMYSLIEVQEFHGELRGSRATALSVDAVKFVDGIIDSGDSLEVPANLLEAFRRAVKVLNPNPKVAHCLAEMIGALEGAEE